jgi:hypothetical protein
MPESILQHSFFHPARGGHAPGNLRDAFCGAVDAYEPWADGDPEPTVEIRDRELKITAICGLLWNCSDIMPYLLYDQINDLMRLPMEMPQRRTYAVGARLLKAMIASAPVGVRSRRVPPSAGLFSFGTPLRSTNARPLTSDD